MSEIQIPYDKTSLSAAIPDLYKVTYLAPRELAAASDLITLVNHALDHPQGGKKLEDFKDIHSVAIAINDKTRPVPNDVLLPPLLQRLAAMGIPDKNIIFLIATGAHPLMPPEEYPRILPDYIVKRYSILCHDAEDQTNLIYLGETEHKTPVWINRQYIEADLRIVVGNIEPHQFMGFSGGVKSAAIGLAGKATISQNHTLMMNTQARLGFYEANPARMDVEEIGQIIQVDFALNAILNGEKKILDVLAGDPIAVMQAGIPRVQQTFQVEVEELFDLMIVSPGGYPKDINLYQSQKALAHAMPVMKEGGTIILVAACPEGTGSQAYEDWMLYGNIESYQQVFERFEAEGFRIGPHKAFQIARDASRARVLLVTEMEADFVRKLLLHPISDLDTALAIALTHITNKSRIGVMPAANTTIPILKEEK